MQHISPPDTLRRYTLTLSHLVAGGLLTVDHQPCWNRCRLQAAVCESKHILVLFCRECPFIRQNPFSISYPYSIRQQQQGATTVGSAPLCRNNHPLSVCALLQLAMVVVVMVLRGGTAADSFRLRRRVFLQHALRKPE